LNIDLLYKYFKTRKDCINYLEQIKWAGKPRCPYCNNFRQTPMPKELRYHCNACGCSYSVITKTLFHKTRIDLQKWFFAAFLYFEVDKNISVRKLALKINVTKDTAAFIISRLKISISNRDELLKKIIECNKNYKNE